MSERSENIVRIRGVNLDGSEVLVKELTKIKGIGFPAAFFIIREAGLDEELRVGKLSSQQIDEIEEMISGLDGHAPTYMLNRRKDRETGEDMHLLGSDLSLQVQKDIEREKKLNTWKGIRHRLGLKVRGQRTKTTGRGKAAVGVAREKLKKAEREKEEEL